MKKIILTSLLLLTGLCHVNAQALRGDAGNVVAISNIRNVVKGYTGSFDIVLTESNTNLYCALGLDVQLPEGFTYVNCAKGALLTDGHEVKTSSQADNTTRFSALADPTADFTGKSGVLLTIYFTVAADAVSGTAAVKGIVKGACFTLGNTSYDAEVANATLTVGNAVTLDENATTAPVAIDNVTVTVNRTIAANTWSTLCLPFPMTATQVTNAFGSDVQLGDFNGYTEEDGDIHVEFVSVSEIAANHPYIIKVSSPITSFSTGSTVNVSPEENPMNNKGTNAKPKNIKAMIGVYTPTTLEEDDLYLKDNSFKYSTSTSKAKLKPYRAYFQFCDFESPSSASRFRLDYVTPTSISTVATGQQAEDAAYYNLQGLRVSKPTAGLYIVNGKKVFIK